jgi:carbonic anhydrase
MGITTMQKLVDGFRQFQKEYFSCHQHLFQRLAGGQRPLALFITCSDSRIDPCLLTHTEPGELFIVRNAGNIVPPYGAVQGGEAATIEYALCVLKIREVIVCGHSHCGAMGGLLHPEHLTELPAVRQWLTHAEATGRILDEKYSHVHEEDARLTAAAKENVLVQLENLRSHPAVAAGLERGQLKLHGWLYKFESGEMFAHDPQQGQFLALGQPG